MCIRDRKKPSNTIFVPYKIHNNRILTLTVWMIDICETIQFNMKIVITILKFWNLQTSFFFYWIISLFRCFLHSNDSRFRLSCRERERKAFEKWDPRGTKRESTAYFNSEKYKLNSIQSHSFYIWWINEWQSILFLKLIGCVT